MLSKYCAVKHLSHIFGEWGIVDKEYFEKTGCMKDCHLNINIPGMEEVSDSTYRCLDDKEDGIILLKNAGIEILEKPVWWFSKNFKKKKKTK